MDSEEGREVMGLEAVTEAEAQVVAMEEVTYF